MPSSENGNPPAFPFRFNDSDVDLVGEGYDCSIRVGYLPNSNLVARKIGSLGVRLYVSPSYVAEKGAPESPAKS